MRVLPALVATGVVCLPIAAGTPRAQQQVPGTFRSGIALVPLDVHVLDRAGRPVTDLAQSDFLVKEDGVPQEIRHFSTHALIAETPVPGAKPALRTSSPTTLTPQNARTFLIVLGRGRLQTGPDKGVDAAIKFVRERLLPQDHVAVLAYNRATDFTTDHEKIARLLERFRDLHERIEATLEHLSGGLAAIYGTKKIPEAAQSPIDQIFQGPGLPGSRQLPEARISEDGRLVEDLDRAVEMPVNPELQAGLDKDHAPPPPSGVITASFSEFAQRNTETRQDLTKINTGIDYLRFIEGEKHLVFVVEDTLFLPRLEDDHSVAAAANDARVVIDTIQTGALGRVRLPEAMYSPIGAMAKPAPMPVVDQAANSTLKTIAQLTGGQWAQNEHAASALDRIDESTRFEYLLGYYPAKSDLDGRYRRIAVTVPGHPEFTVLYRHGYQARQQLVPTDRREFTTYRRIAMAGGYAGVVSDIKVKLTASFGKTSADTGEVVANATIGAERIGFADVDGRHVGALDIAIFCGDDKQALVGDAWQHLDLKLKDDTYERTRREGVTHTAHVPVRAQPRYVKIVVYDYSADLVGTAIVNLR